MDIDREIFDDVQDALPPEFLTMSAEAIQQRTRLLDNEIRVLRDETSRMTLEQRSTEEKIKENKVDHEEISFGSGIYTRHFPFHYMSRRRSSSTTSFHI